MEQIRISHEAYMNWKDQPILHDEDDWDGKYRTYGEMWEGEGYIVEKGRNSKMKNYTVYYVIKRYGHAEIKTIDIEAKNKKEALAQVEGIAQQKYGRHAFHKTTTAPTQTKLGLEWDGMIYTRAWGNYLY